MNFMEEIFDIRSTVEILVNYIKITICSTVNKELPSPKKSGLDMHDLFWDD